VRGCSLLTNTKANRERKGARYLFHPPITPPPPTHPRSLLPPPKPPQPSLSRLPHRPRPPTPISYPPPPHPPTRFRLPAPQHRPPQPHLLDTPARQGRHPGWKLLTIQRAPVRPTPPRHPNRKPGGQPRISSEFVGRLSEGPPPHVGRRAREGQQRRPVDGPRPLCSLPQLPAHQTAVRSG